MARTFASSTRRGLGVYLSHSGIYELIQQLEKITDSADEYLPWIVYDGMEVVADKMRSEVEGLKTSKQYKTKGRRYCTENEKKGLIESFGVTPISRNFNADDAYDANAGFDGYNEHIKSEPANPMIANFINRGTSYMKPQPFISRTKRVAETQAVQAMQKRLNDAIEAITN